MCNTNLHYLPCLLQKIVRQFVYALLLTVFTIAQSGDRDARVAQWNGYKLPDGEFARFVDRQKGFSFWHPTDWKHRALPNGVNLFQADQNTASLLTMTEDIPEGYGVANYASSYLRGVRDQSVVEDSVTVRRVMMNGLEWREVYYDADKQGTQFHQTAWMTAVGPRVYLFVVTTRPGEVEQGEPILKRVLATTRFAAAAGHWIFPKHEDEEFESLRTRFAENTKIAAGREVAAAAIAGDLRAAKLPFDVAVNRLTELFGQSPDAAFDLAADADPQVRAAAINALGQSRQDALGDHALVWALSDQDVFASTAAARALVARGARGLDAVKSRLSARWLSSEAIVRAGLAFGEQAANELIAEALRSDDIRQQLAAMQLALALPKFDQPLPYSKLLSPSIDSTWYATIAVIRKHVRGPAAAAASAALASRLRMDFEWWAARALGEVAQPQVVPELAKRIAEIDARLATLGKSTPARASKPNRSRQQTAPATAAVPADQSGSVESPTYIGYYDFLKKPEDTRLAMIRAELDVAVRKIGFRDRWNKARDEAERRVINSEISKEHGDLALWARRTLLPSDVAQQPLPSFDVSRITSAPSTGETLFPQSTFSYVMAPNLGATMGKLDAALSGVQMATVRDQMTFALILNILKTTLADKTGTSATNDANKATGIDLESPIAMAAWMPEASGKAKSGVAKNNAEMERAATHSAVVLRVTDRTRFERLLSTYQEQLSDLNLVTTATAGLTRFVGSLPAALPVVFAALASDEMRGTFANRVPGAPARSAIQTLKPFAFVREEKLGNLSVIVFDKLTITTTGTVTPATVYLAYLGETAIITSSKGALADLMTTASSTQASIAQSQAFAQARRESGEVIFFSDLPVLIQSAFSLGEFDDATLLEPIIKAFGAESGALRISPTSWETVFDIGLGENEFTGSFKPFKATALAAPRELLPQTTVLFAGAMIDPVKIFSVLKKLERASTVSAALATDSARGRNIDEDIERQIVPQMQGEIAAALISFAPLFNNDKLPAMIFAARLKGNALAETLRVGKLFAKFNRVPNATIASSPVVALGEEDEAPFAAIVGDYFVLADSVETLKLLEAKEKFSSSRDFARSLQNVPENLALFATYNLESAFDEASKAMNKGESQQMLPFISALVHAFHSQRAFVAFNNNTNKTSGNDTLRGTLAVSFDREGRYSVGDLTRRTGDFDVANAIIATKGLNVIESPRVEAMTLRITTKLAGVAPRVRDDLAKFSWQRVEPGKDSNNDSTVIVTTAARRIPEKLTVQLPVSGAEFAPFLAPTPQINSRAPEIVSLAKQIAGDDKDARSVARKIGDWTYKNLKWKKVQSDAVETLASREADCLEHSELYVALARASGLPARVVTGAALSGGSFGAHAWVEVYLGKWVELDPTWGLMEHVDATHLRFDGDAFTSYAMLNQLELEITAARRTVADFQRDPIRLVKEFSLEETTRDLAFDLPLTVEQSLGAGRWEKLDEKQRAAVIKAFERTVRGLWDTWNAELPEPVRVMRNETKGNRSVLTVLRGDALLRLTLMQRDGAWFITEHEVVDDTLPEFADALGGALQPESRRGRIYEISFDGAIKHLDRLIAAEGEKPELLLLKARVLDSQQDDEDLSQALKETEQKAEKNAAKSGAPVPQVAQANSPTTDQAVDLMKRITTRWPDFAPAHLLLGRELLYTVADDALAPLSKNNEQAIAALRRYAQLVPDDPRPWRDLAQAFEQTEKFEDAEKAYRAAIERDRNYLDHHAMLINFLLDREDLEKAKSAFAQMLKIAPDQDEVFAYLNDEEGFDPDAAKIREEMLQAFPREVSSSKSGLLMLADVQEAQDKTSEAIKSMQRAIAIEPAAEDYEDLSRLYRKQRRFIEALSAANQALKLDDTATYIHFERACSLAQLGRKREAIVALKQIAAEGQPLYFDAEEPDLQPLSPMPEFKALREKMKQPAKTTELESEQKSEQKSEKPQKP